MSTDRCQEARQWMALQVAATLGPAEQGALHAHLEGCDACRREFGDLAPLSQALALADLEHLEPEDADVPIELRARVLGGLARERRSVRRRRLGAAIGATAAAIAAGVVALSFTGGTTTRSVTLSAPPGVTATAELTAQPWGTSLRLEESAQQTSQVLSVSMETTSGTWWQAGTYKTVAGQDVVVNMACAVPMSKIGTIWVRDSAGRVVLYGPQG